MPESGNYDLDRRGFLGAAAAGTGALVLAGCGGDDSPAAPATGGSTDTRGTPKNGGTFRVGLSDSGSGDTVDPLWGDTTYASIALCRNLYDRLMETDPAKPEIRPSLAEEMTPEKDLKYWDVRLRDAEWHDGKPVTADDVIFTLRRILDPKAPGGSAAALDAIDTKRLQKLDQKTVRIHLKFPDSTIRTTFGAHGGASIVPVDFDPKKPVGCGPFKLDSFKPGERTTFIRNDNHWGDEGPYLDRLEFVGFADPGSPRLNALATGQIDGVDRIDFALARSVEGNSSLKMLISPAYTASMFEMNQTQAPFDDPRVRQAIRLIADREQVVATALGGSRFATVGNDLMSPQDPLYNKSIPQRTQDIEQAKALLKQAGKENLTVELVVADATTGVTQTAQVLKENAQAAGVTINIRTIPDVTTYFTKHFLQAAFKFTYWQTQALLPYCMIEFAPDGPYNASHYNDEQFTKLLTEARSTTDFEKQKAAMDEAQQILWDSGTQGLFGFSRTVEAYNAKFSGFHTDLWGYSLNGLRFDTVYEV